MASTKYVVVDAVDPFGVATVMIAREDRLNALNSVVVGELREVIRQLAQDDSVRAVVLTGAGSRAFVAGGDIPEMLSLEGDEVRAFVSRGQLLTREIELMPQATIAAVNGFALGGGTEIALACDIRLASEHAEFGLPEVSLGLLPGWGGTQRLVRLVGRGLALEVILTGRRIGAEEALSMGLVNRVVPSGSLRATAHEMAKAIAHNSPAAVRRAKAVVHAGADLPLDEGLGIEREAWIDLVGHPDRIEGLSAFLDKRPPEWRLP